MTLKKLLLLNFILVAPAFAIEGDDEQTAVVEIAAIGDINLGGGNSKLPAWTRNILEDIRENHPQLDYTLGLGDYWEAAYGADYKKEAGIFMRDLEAHFQHFTRKLFPTLGNHDAPGNHNKEFGSAKRHAGQLWRSKKPVSKYPKLSNGEACDKYYPYMYCYVEKGIMNVSLNDSCDSYDICRWELSLDPQSAWTIHQKDWVTMVLQKADQLKASGGVVATIVYGHVPLYSNAFHKGKIYANGNIARQRGYKDMEKLEGLLVKHADLFVSAHTHVGYPGIIKYPDGVSTLRVLSVPCAGTGPRYMSRYSGQSQVKGFHGYGLIRVDRQSGKIETQLYKYSGGSSGTTSLYPKSNLREKIKMEGDPHKWLDTQSL